jgi:two-component system chemotaxis sensor kinase CheA
VRQNIEEVGGSVSLTSRAGRGAAIVLRIPLTLAILPAFIVTAGSERFALPQHSVEEILELDTGEQSPVICVQGAPVLNLADGPLPLASLSDLTRNREHPPAPASPLGLILKMRAGAHGFAIIVDDIVDLQEIVLKPLPTPLQRSSLFSAGAILGDGSVVLVLDASGLAAKLGLPKSNAARIAPPVEAKAAAPRTPVVIFRSGGPALRALPVSAVARIQTLGPAEVEVVDGASVVRCDGRLISLVRLDRASLVDFNKKSLTALILQMGDDRLAVVVDEIVDVVDDEISVELPGLSRGVLGVANLRGEATEVLDPSSFFDRRAGPIRLPTATKTGVASVLIVEPAEFFRTMIAAALARSGFEVHAVGDGAEALAAIGRSTPFAAALFDVDLAAVRSGQLAREIRAARANDAPLLIGLASHGGRSWQAKARRAGLSRAVGKFDRIGMISALRSLGACEATGLAA